MKHKEKFFEALKNCNKEQLKAIYQTEGTVLVLAGPGTGKTQILSLRIAYILEQQDVTCDNILCLTYTDAGRTAMRLRLEEFIGPDAYKVHIHTFHSFCNDLIKRYKSYFLDVEGYESITELEVAMLMRKLLDGLPNDHLLKKFKGDIYSEIPRLRSLFDVIKKEKLVPEQLIKSAEKHIENLPHTEGFYYKKNNAAKSIKAGDPNLNKIQEETERMEKFKAAVLLYYDYTRLMQKEKRYDFHDMIHWVIESMQKHEAFLANLQEKYLYILVDEFQDTNGAQSQLLELLCSFWENPNLFVVGDDDQSIYSFQGAELSRIEDFIKNYQSVFFPIVLTGNYRSQQEILTAAEHVISHNRNRIIHNPILQQMFEQTNGAKLHKNIQSLHPKYLPENKRFYESKKFNNLRIFAFENKWHEEIWIVDEIKKIITQNLDLSKVAIIYRKHAQIENIMRILQIEKIPFEAKLRTDILQVPLINHILSLVKYVTQGYQTPDDTEYLLFEILHYPYWNIPFSDIQKLVFESKRANKKIIQSISDKNFMFQIGLEKARAVSQFSENIQFWQQHLFLMTTQELFESIIIKSGIAAHVMQSAQKIPLLEMLTTLFDHLKSETKKNASLSLAEWLTLIDLMKEHKIRLSVEQIYGTGAGINLLTAHGSKGLEFEHVYMIGCSEEYWSNKKSSNYTYKFPGAGAPDTLDDSELLNEERRLFYVGMTRAASALTLTYATKKQSSDLSTSTVSRCTFVSELVDKTKIEVKTQTVREEKVSWYLQNLLQEVPMPDSVLLETNLIERFIKNYELSVTHISKYLRCPLSFYYENVLQVPTARNPNAGFGTAVHEALHRLFLQMKLNNYVFPTKETFLEYFMNAMQKYRAHFTPQTFSLRSDYGTQLLAEYYDYYVNTWNKITSTEYRPHTVAGKVPITGSIDKLEFTGKYVNVVDYKTGKPENATKHLKRPSLDKSNTDNFEETYGGDYWRQLTFYKILIDLDKRKDWEMRTGEINFIEKNAEGKFISRTLTITDEDVKLVWEQIQKTYEGIKAHDFHGCGRAECIWCTFTKNYYTTLLPNPNIEELET